MKKIIFITMALFSAFFVCAQVAPNPTPVYQLNPAPDSGMVAYSIANYKGIRNQPIWVYLDSLVTGGSSTALTTSYVDTYSTGNTNVQTIVDYIIPRLSLQQVSDNTWYVSTGGNNSAGIKGDPTHPLRDPWAAKDSCVSGDQIFVFQGLYTSGIVGSGADRENSGTDLEYTALNKDSVTLVLDAGAQVQNTAAILQPLFYDTTGQKFTVIGEGAIRNLDSRARLAYIDNEDSDLYINIYRLTNGENAASWSYGFYLINWSRFEVLTEISEVSNSRFIYTPSTSNVVDASFTYSTKDFYIPSITDQTFNFNRGTFKNGTIDINMQNVYGNPLYTFIFTGLGLDSSVMNINIGAMNLTGFNATYQPFALSPNNGAALKNSIINFNCDACQCDANMFSLGRANGANEKSFFRITGNYYTTSLLQPLIKFGAQVVNTPIYIDAVMTTLHTPVIQKNNQADLHLSGVFETYADTNVIVSSNTAGRTTLGNLQIKQPAGATSVSIRSTIPDTINTYSAYSLAATSSNVVFKTLTKYGAGTATWLKPELEADDVLIESENTLTLDDGTGILRSQINFESIQVSETETDVYSYNTQDAYSLGVEARNYDTGVNSVPSIYMDYSSDKSELFPGIYLQKRGLSDINTPIPLIDEDVIGNINFFSQFESAKMSVVASGNHTATSTPADIILYNTPIGSNNLQQTFKINSEGDIYFSKYGTGTKTGTPATYPAFDATGNIIESATPYGGGDTANIYNSNGTFNGPRAINAGAFDYAVTNIEDFTSRAISHWFRGPADEYYLLMQKSGSFGNFVLRGDVFQLQGRTGSGAPTWMQFNDLAGGQYFGIRAPDVVPTSYLYQWPDSLGAVGDQLTIESISGTDVVLKWRDPMTGIPLSMESGSEGGRINVPDLIEERVGDAIEPEQPERTAPNWLWAYLFGFLGGLSAYIMIALFKFALSKRF